MYFSSSQARPRAQRLGLSVWPVSYGSRSTRLSAHRRLSVVLRPVRPTRELSRASPPTESPTTRPRLAVLRHDRLARELSHAPRSIVSLVSRLRAVVP